MFISRLDQFVLLSQSDSSKHCLGKCQFDFFSFVQYVEEATSGQVQLDITPFASFYDFFLATSTKNEKTTGTQVEMASRLLPRSLAENDPAKVAKILLSLGVHMV